MPTNTSVSFQMYCMPTPFSIIAFTIMMNHFAGIMLLITCIGIGILLIGKMKPERIITGNINPISESIIAVCCEFDIVEIKIPNESADSIKRMLSHINKKRLPLIGILNTKKPNTKITIALIIDRKIYGNTFPIIT